MNVSIQGDTRQKPAKHGRKRVRILESALQLISQHGLQNIGLKEIAAHLDMTHPALYYYFKSKDELVFEAVRMAMNALIADLEASQTGLPDNPELRLLTLCTAHIEHELARGQEVSFVNAIIYGPLRNTSWHSEEERAEIRALQLRVLNLYRDCVLDGQKSGDFIGSDATRLAFGVLGIVSYTVAWYRPDGKLGIGAAARDVAVQALRSVKSEFRSSEKI